MDYIISWTLRHAADEFKEEAPILWEYCRAILGKLVGKDLKKGATILSEICVYKQDEKIDLWVEFKLNNENHAILIENKYYGALRFFRNKEGSEKNQLEIYKQKFDEYYENEPSYKRHYCLIRCIKRDDEKFNLYYDKAKNLGFAVFSLKELVREKGLSESDFFNEFWEERGPSESDIFNEFWREDW